LCSVYPLCPKENRDDLPQTQLHAAIWISNVRKVNSLLSSPSVLFFGKRILVFVFHMASTRFCSIEHYFYEMIPGGINVSDIIIFGNSI